MNDNVQYNDQKVINGDCCNGVKPVSYRYPVSVLNL